MNAEIFSLLAALLFSINFVLTSKGLMKVDPFKGTFITIIVAVPILVAFCLINGDFSYSNLLDQIVIVYLALAGILHLLVGVTFSHCSTKIIGASRFHTLALTQVVSAPVFGFLILKEAIGINLFIGVMFIAVGTWLILLSTTPSKKQGERQKCSINGIILGLAVGAIWGLTPILVRVGVLGVKSPLLSIFISYLFAAVGYPILLIGAGHHKDFRNIDKPCFGYLLAAGAAACVGQVFKYSALFLANVSFVAPIIGASPLLTTVLSYLFIRKIEMINLKMVIGLLLAVLGLYVVILT